MSGPEASGFAPPDSPPAPCRPYRIGDHAAWLRGRLLRSMLVAAVIAGIAWGAIPLGLAIAVPAPETRWALGVGGPLIFPLVFGIAHWTLIGRRRWRVLEFLVWAGQEQARSYHAVTGIRDPTDRPRAREWLSAHPAGDDDPPEAIVWRAHVLLLLDDPAAGRAEASRLPADGAWAFARRALEAQADLLEGRPVPIGTLAQMSRAEPDPRERALETADVAGLAAQVAWTCGRDDVAAAAAYLPLAGRQADRFLLRSYWLPMLGVMVAITTAISVVSALTA